MTRTRDDGGTAWRLRVAVPGDAPALTRLHLDVWDDAYRGLMPDALLDSLREDVPTRVKRWRGRLGPDQPPTLVAETTAERPGLIGFASAGPARDDLPPAALELWSLYARSAWWGTGVGQALATAVVGDADAYLWVLEGNERAASFYRRQGFAADGASRADDGYGRDLRMVRVRAPRPG